MIHPVNSLCSIVCHRDPLRSFVYDGNIYLCARCTGIYIGGLFGYVLLKYSPLKINLRDMPKYSLAIVLGLLILPSVVDKVMIQNHNLSLLIKNVILFNGLSLGYSFSIICIFISQKNERCDYLKKSKLNLVRLASCLLLISVASLLIVPRIAMFATVIPLFGVLLIFYISNYNILIGLYDKYDLQANSNLMKIVNLLLIIIMSINELIIIYAVKHLR